MFGRKKVYIYGLRLKREDQTIRYIGKTDNLKRRLSDHKSKAKRGFEYPVLNWIRKHGEKMIQMVRLETTDEKNWEEAERRLIAEYRESTGGRLLNVTAGGDGYNSGENNLNAKLSQEQVDNMRAQYLMGAPRNIILKNLSFKLSTSAANNILRNTTWHDKEYDPPKGVFYKASGEDAGNSKLTWDIVNPIRKNWRKGIPKLAAEFGISQPNVCSILNNISWHDETYVPIKRKPGKPKKLSEEQVIAIRIDRNTHNLSWKQIQKKYSISEGVLQKVLKGTY